MVNLEVPWLNIMSKMDLVTSNVEDKGSGRNGIRTRKDIARWVSATASVAHVHRHLTAIQPRIVPSLGCLELGPSHGVIRAELHRICLAGMVCLAHIAIAPHTNQPLFVPHRHSDLFSLITGRVVTHQQR